MFWKLYPKRIKADALKVGTRAIKRKTADEFISTHQGQESNLPDMTYIPYRLWLNKGLYEALSNEPRKLTTKSYGLVK
jgi:hypothetical protein